MKHPRFWIMFGWLVVLLIPLSVVTAQGPTPKTGRTPSTNAGTVFTYQGQLKNNGVAVNGNCDFGFRLYDAVSSGTQIGSVISTTVPVANGLFSAPLDFGANAINGDARWLDIQTRCGGGAFAALTRQVLTPAPMALALPGLYTTQNITSPNVIGGFSGNVISSTVYGGTIGGGGDSGLPNKVWNNYATIGGGRGNLASGDHATIGGGYSNKALGWSGTIGGGVQNIVAFNGYATIGGGMGNNANGTSSTIGGGVNNTADGIDSTIGGGLNNYTSGDSAVVSGGFMINATGDYSAVGGGSFNYASGKYSSMVGGYSNLASGTYATVPGGANNTATMSYTLAAGRHANAVNQGAFVWADSAGTDFTSTANDQFLVRAAGGVGINTSDTSANALTVNGKVIAGGTGAPAGSDEPFVSRGVSSGISMDDRAGGTNPRWVMYPSAGTLRFYNSTIGDALSINTAGNVAVPNLGVAGSDHLCRNASNQIATCSSSLRYKHNVADLDLGLAAVAQLRPVVFDWNDTNAPDLGFVAEEVNQVTPLLTTKNANGQIEGVKYDRVAAILVKGMQEQQTQIAELKAQNSQLESRLVALEQNIQTNNPANSNNIAMIIIGAFIGVAVIRRSQ